PRGRRAGGLTDSGRDSPAGDLLGPLRPLVARLKADQLPGRRRVVDHLAHRPAERVDDGEADLRGRLDGAGEETSRVARTEVHVRPPFRARQLVQVFTRPRAPAEARGD